LSFSFFNSAGVILEPLTLETLEVPNLGYEPLEPKPGALPEPGLPEPDLPAEPGFAALDFPLEYV
jgi:hypothetical protein